MKTTLQLWHGVIPALACTGLTSGCVSSKFQPAPPDTPPALVLNLTVENPPVEASLHTLIVSNGPGSWRRDAPWDEYVVEVANRGNGTAMFVGARLIDHEGFMHAPRRDPLALEPYVQARSGAALEKAGFALAATGRATAGAAYMLAQAGAASGAPIAAPVALGVIAIIGSGVATLVPHLVDAVDNKGQRARKGIIEEFNQRSFDWPVVLSPGQSSHGSLFFPSKVNARELMLRFKVSSGLRDVRIPVSAETVPESARLTGQTPAVDKAPE